MELVWCQEESPQGMCRMPFLTSNLAITLPSFANNSLDTHLAKKVVTGPLQLPQVYQGYHLSTQAFA